MRWKELQSDEVGFLCREARILLTGLWGCAQGKVKGERGLPGEEL